MLMVFLLILVRFWLICYVRHLGSEMGPCPSLWPVITLVLGCDIPLRLVGIKGMCSMTEFGGKSALRKERLYLWQERSAHQISCSSYSLLLYEYLSYSSLFS